MKSFKSYTESLATDQQRAMQDAQLDRKQDLKLADRTKNKEKGKLNSDLNKLRQKANAKGYNISFNQEEWDAAAIDVATDYFLDEGINEEGIDLIIEEIGLEEFVDFVLDPPSEQDLMEERSARKASAKAPSYEKVKAKVDAGDAARKAAGKGEYAKTAAAKRNYGDEDNTNYGDDKPAAKKPAKVTVTKKKVASPKKKAEVSKKVAKAVPAAKKKQPAKKAEKKGLGAKIAGAVKKGVERHQKAVGNVKKKYVAARKKGEVPEKRAKEFAKGVKSGVKTAVKFAKDVKKVVGEGREDRDPPPQFEKGDDDRGNPDYMKSVSYADEKKWERLQKMRKASKKASVKAKVDEAKVDTVKKLDDEGKEDARNYRRFGTKHNQHGHAVLRRALHRSDRGHKKIKGDKTQYVEKESVNLGEEEYDHYKDRHLEKYGSRPGEYDRPRPATGGGKHSGNDKMTKRKNSDKAVDNVVADLKKKYGDNAVLHSKRSYVAGKRVK